MTTVVRWVKPLKQGLPSLEAARTYVQGIRDGRGQASQAPLEIHYNERKYYGRWSVVAIGMKPLPGGTPCGKCGKKHHEENDYLCPNCRKENE